MIDRTLQPPFHNSLDFKLPSPLKILSNGVGEVWYLPSEISNAVKIDIVYKAGKYYEENNGDAQFTLHLLDKGTKSKNALEIANELDYNGAHLESKLGFDFSTISLYPLSKNIEKLLPLLFSIIHEPIFPEKEIEIYKKLTIENLKVNLEKNEFIASNLIREKTFGDHPYGKSLNISDTQNINRERILRFYRRFKPFKIFIIGKLQEADLLKITQSIELIEQNPDDSKVLSELAVTDTLQEGPSKVQSSLRLATKTINKNHADWPAVLLLNHTLGGYFGSRLMKNIREEKGLTYGIHSSIQTMRHASWINIGAEINASNYEIALIEINKELTNITDIDEEELEIVKNHLIGSIQNDVTNLFSAAERIKNIILTELPSYYYSILINKLSTLTKSELIDKGRTYFSAENFSTVIIK